MYITVILAVYYKTQLQHPLIINRTLSSGGRFLSFALPQLCRCVSSWSLQVWRCVQVWKLAMQSLLACLFFCLLSTSTVDSGLSVMPCAMFGDIRVMPHFTWLKTLWSEKEGQSSHMAHKLAENYGDFSSIELVPSGQSIHVCSLIHRTSIRNVITLHVEVSVAQFFLYRKSFRH